MQAELKNFHCPDIDYLETYIPDKADDFSFYLELTIGPEGERGEEIFGVVICTPKSLYDEFAVSDIIFPENRIIVFKYDYNQIINKITHFVETKKGAKWQDIAHKIIKVTSWEFEDYH